jgi:Domain of unknown function (DUF5615)
MSRPRFLADHDLNEFIIEGVLRREPSVEFVRVRELGLERQPDPAVLEHAARDSLILVSHDVNTMSAHAYARVESGQRLAGLLMAHQATPVAAVIESLLLIWSASEAEEWENQVRFLPL